MPFIIPANTLASGGFEVANSCRFNGTSSDYLSKTPSSSGNRKTWTASVWLKGQPSTTTNNIAGQAVYSAGNAATDRTHFYFTNGIFEFRTEISNTQQIITTNQTFTDPAAWYHFVVAVDSTQSTAANRVKIYVNGVQITSFAAAAYLAQDADTYVNHTVLQTVGRASYIANQASGSYWNGYMAEFVLLDGTAATPTAFGEADEDTGIWKPIDVSGLTAGTNGFYLDFKASANLGNDAFGGTDLDEYNLTAVDQSTDTCTNNFATWNPLFRKGTTTPAFTEGNLKSTFDDTGANEFALTTFGVSAGKWYAEVKWTANTGTAATATGILDMAYSGTADPNDAVTNAFGYFGSGTKNVSGTASSYGNSYADGNIVGIAIDMDNNKLYFSKNGTFQNSGDPTTGATGTGAIAIVAGVTYGIFATDYNDQVAELNTGSPAFSGTDKADGNGFGSFEYEPPSGYLAICTKNLAENGG